MDKMVKIYGAKIKFKATQNNKSVQRLNRQSNMYLKFIIFKVHTTEMYVLR